MGFRGVASYDHDSLVVFGYFDGDILTEDQARDLAAALVVEADKVADYKAETEARARDALITAGHHALEDTFGNRPYNLTLPRQLARAGYKIVPIEEG